MHFSFKLLILWLCSFYVYAGTCRYPIPDGGPPGYKSSYANLDGKLIATEGKVLTIKERKTGRLVKITVPKDKFPIYSAFGGDSDTSELKLGVYAWVWYKDCQSNGAKSPSEVGYFKIYSADPKDQPNEKSILLGRRN